jgi:hypothetical protein
VIWREHARLTLELTGRGSIAEQHPVLDEGKLIPLRLNELLRRAIE